MKKFFSLVLVLGCVVLFSQIASAAIKGTYTAEVNVTGSFSFSAALVDATTKATGPSTITWSDYSGAYASVDNWKNAAVAIKATVTNQKAGVTVQLYQNNKSSNTAGYENTIGFDETGSGDMVYGGLIRQNSSGAQRFVMGMKISTTTVNPTVAPNYSDTTTGFFLKDKSDYNFATVSHYYTILTDQGVLMGINASSQPEFALFASGDFYIHFGANFRDAVAGNYATQSITLESFNE